MIRARLEQLRWHVGRPFRAARLALRALNYEPQHVDPWGPDAERIYDPQIVQIPFAGLGYTLPLTLPAPRLEPVLSAPRIVGGEHVAAWEAATDEPDLLLGEAWLHAHWWWYGQERQREADDYHTWVLADRRRWRLENGLGPIELAAAA